MSESPLRDVVRAFESTGAKGGLEMVHVLSCGCWIANRRRVPAKKLRCHSCRIREEQSGDGRHGAPRAEDIAWQAFVAGMQYWSTVGRFVFSSPPSGGDALDVVAQRFRVWWARR